MELLRNHRRVLLVTASAAVALSLVAIFTVDGPLAVALSSLSSNSRRAVQSFVSVVEVLFAFGVSPYLYGAMLVIAGLLAFWSKKSRLVP